MSTTASRRGNHIQTYTGRHFWPLDPDPDQIDIVDIAHALSHICRFGGHVKKFYSVGQHCILASTIPKSKIDQLRALLHDASEAYIGDIVSPLKTGPGYSYIRNAEERLHEAISKRFKLGENFLNIKVKEADLKMLLAEARDLMGGPSWMERYKDVIPFNQKIEPWTPANVKSLYLGRFEELTR